MTQDTLKARIEREAASFNELYKTFNAALENTKKTLEKEGADKLLPDWLYLFEMPLQPRYMEHDLVTDPIIGADGKAVLPPYDAVVRTIRKLKLHEELVGAISSSDHRILREDLTANDFAAQYGLKKAKQKEMGLIPIVRAGYEYSDAVFWRTLIEVFCRAFMSHAHGSRPWSIKRKVELAIDLIEIRDAAQGKQWSIKMAREALRDAPYSERYAVSQPTASMQSAIGEDRIRDIVKNIIGGMKGTGAKAPLARLRSRYPHEFQEIERERSRPATLAELQSRLASNRQN